ncbi:MAG: CCA tRNA nucleotidyltransferase [Litoreibacter sp.]
MRHVSGAWLTADATQRVARLLTKSGHQAYFVGGCVRNTLMSVAVSDIDMATDARPDDVMRLAHADGLKVIPTGLDHGTVTVMSDGIAHEITTFRHDVATDGRHADVRFSDTLAEDAQRRDFTMNALYADAKGLVTDPTGGLNDLEARRVKFVGTPETRISEDYLRILRFFRFHAWYGEPAGGIDPEGLSACAKGAEGLDGLSRERIGSEMIKLLSAPDPSPSIAAMHQTGILARVMPGADPKALAPLVHFESETKRNWLTRATVMGGEDLKDAWRISKRDATDLQRLRALIGLPTPLHEIAFRDGAHMAWNTAFARASVFETPVDPDASTKIEIGSQAIFPVKAADLSNLRGPALGQKLRAMETAWIASAFTMSKADLLSL